MIEYPALGDELVSLRPWAAADLDSLIAAGNDPVVRRFRYSLPVDLAGASEWLARREADRIDGTAVELAIADPDGSGPKGSVSLWAINARHGHAMVSYWVGPGARGRGLATAAVRLLARWAFDEVGLVRLQLYIEPENVASQRVAERAGFVREGRLRGHFAGRDGSRVDTLV